MSLWTKLTTPLGKRQTGERLYKTVNGPSERHLCEVLADGWTVDARGPFLWRGTNYGTTYYLSKPNPDFKAPKEAK